jgi:hypothetical protein
MASKGLQPVCLFLAIFPSVLCVILVSIRVWTRTRKKLFGLGECPSIMSVKRKKLTP